MAAPYQPGRRLVVSLSPLRSLRVRQALAVRIHRLQRAERLRLEARGDDRLSKPARAGMDVRLAALLGRDGYFVEAGAYDGYTESNTYYLERFMGWRGLLVEPVGLMYREAVLDRPRSRVVNCALVPPEAAGRPTTLWFGGKMTVTAGAQGSSRDDRAWAGTSLIRRERDVYSFQAPGRTLSELLDEAQAPAVDLLSLDLEGYEPEALRGLDLERHTPRYILVEAHGDEARARIEAVLGDGYVVAQDFAPWDVLYRHVSVPAQAAARPGAGVPLAASARVE
jgi:FkbM family methyltransferase